MRDVTWESRRSQAWSSVWPVPGTKYIPKCFLIPRSPPFVSFVSFPPFYPSSSSYCSSAWLWRPGAWLPSNRDSDSHGTANTAATAAARSTIQEPREMRVNVPHQSSAQDSPSKEDEQEARLMDSQLQEEGGGVSM